MTTRDHSNVVPFWPSNGQIGGHNMRRVLRKQSEHATPEMIRRTAAADAEAVVARITARYPTTWQRMDAIEALLNELYKHQHVLIHKHFAGK
jgi:hypothetical protein